MRKYVSSPVDLDRPNTAHAMDTHEEFDEAGDILLSVRNNGIEKFSVDKDGNISATNVDNSLASHYVVDAGSFTTIGGDADESIPAVGALDTDIAFVQLKVKGATPRTILTAIADTDEIVLEFSGDPADDHEVSWQLLRAMA